MLTEHKGQIDKKSWICFIFQIYLLLKDHFYQNKSEMSYNIKKMQGNEALGSATLL